MERKVIAGMGAMLVGALVISGGFGSALAEPNTATNARYQAIQPHRIRANNITVRPIKGPGGTEVRVKGYVVSPCPGGVGIEFEDAAGHFTNVGGAPGPNIDVTVHVPSGAALGGGRFVAVRAILDRPHHCRLAGVGEAPFTVTNGAGIFGFSPRMGSVGTVVTITGIRFTGATKVKFNGTPAAFIVDSDSQITATAPARATTGQIKIVTPIGKAGSGPDFVVT